MDGEEQVLVCGRADDIPQRPELPRPERGVPQYVGAGELQRHDEGDDKLGQWLGAAELRDLQRKGEIRDWRFVELISPLGGGFSKQTSGCALMIASLLVLCGSSVYVQKKSCTFWSTSSCACAAAAAAAVAPFNLISPPSAPLPTAAVLRLPALALVVVVEEFAIVCW